MLHCNMNAPPTVLRSSLHGLMTDLVRARQQRDLGRLALLCYCEVRHWARRAGEQHLADHSLSLITETPADRTAFLEQVDALMGELEDVCLRLGVADTGFAQLSRNR